MMAFFYVSKPQKRSLNSLASPDLGYRRVEEEVQEPVSRDTSPVLGTLQLEQVGRPPEESGREALELHAHDLVDGELAPQLHQLAHGLVLEGGDLVLPAVDAGENVPGQGLTLLDRRLGVGRDSLAILVHVGRAVADSPYVLPAWHTHVGVRLGALVALLREVQILHLHARAVAGGPDDVLGLYLPAVVEEHVVL